MLKLDPTGTRILAAVRLGGRSDDRAKAIALDRSGNLWVAGTTSSPDFPCLSATQTALGGSSDAFLARLSAAELEVTYDLSRRKRSRMRKFDLGGVPR